MKSFSKSKKIVVVDLDNLPSYIFRNKSGRLEMLYSEMSDADMIAAVSMVELLEKKPISVDRQKLLRNDVSKSWRVISYWVATQLDQAPRSGK